VATCLLLLVVAAVVARTAGYVTERELQMYSTLCIDSGKPCVSGATKTLVQIPASCKTDDSSILSSWNILVHVAAINLP
jgi:hypothetical protein